MSWYSQTNPKKAPRGRVPFQLSSMACTIGELGGRWPGFCPSLTAEGLWGIPSLCRVGYHAFWAGEAAHHSRQKYLDLRRPCPCDTNWPGHSTRYGRHAVRREGMSRRVTACGAQERCLGDVVVQVRHNPPCRDMCFVACFSCCPQRSESQAVPEKGKAQTIQPSPQFKPRLIVLIA